MCSPQVEVPNTVQFIKGKSFMIDLFGEKRTLLVGENYSYFPYYFFQYGRMSINNRVWSSIYDLKIVEHMFSGKDLSSKKIDIFSSILTSENIPIPSTSHSSVTDSTIAPFS